MKIPHFNLLLAFLSDEIKHLESLEELDHEESELMMLIERESRMAALEIEKLDFQQKKQHKEQR